MQRVVKDWDVIVAGAGPGGCATAALLARDGLRVLVLEKLQFQRFRIGESLLPACLPVLESVGLAPDPDVFVHKRGAEFVSESTSRQGSFDFKDALAGCPRHAYHVERAAFDLALRDRAVASGAQVEHGVSVENVEFRDEGVEVRSSSDSFRARYFVDATGQNRLLARRMSSVAPYNEFGLAAVFTHFNGVGASYEHVFGEAGDIRILVLPEGWGWIIPLPRRRISYGLVARRPMTTAMLDEHLGSSPLARTLTEGAQRGETHTVGNYSYRNTVPNGARFTTVGDAWSFLDPLFSSGVTLALRGAASAAPLVSEAMRRGREGDPALLSSWRDEMDRAGRTFAALIRRFYHGSFAQSFFLRPIPVYELRRGVMSVLAGDVWRRDNPFQEMLLGSRALKPGASNEPNETEIRGT